MQYIYTFLQFLLHRKINLVSKMSTVKLQWPFSIYKNKRFYMQEKYEIIFKNSVWMLGEVLSISASNRPDFVVHVEFDVAFPRKQVKSHLLI